jgi:hypothetical protein
MADRQQVKSALLFVVAVATFLLVTFPAFMVFGGWTYAITLAEANQRYPGQIDPNWPGVADYHGRPHEWRLGTIGENPVGFVVCSVVLALGLLVSMYSMYRSHRLGLALQERRAESDAATEAGREAGS